MRFESGIYSTTAHDDVEHPPHYTQHPSGIECIQITEHMNFNLGNAIKYVWRAGLKSDNPVEDLRKAAWYITREISRLEKQSSYIAEQDGKTLGDATNPEK